MADELRLARASIRVANATALPAEPPDPVDEILVLLSAVVGFQHTITPGRWQSTLHTFTYTGSY